jgi:3-oxoadipate enol-lactonase
MSDTLATHRGYVDLPGTRLAYEIAGNGKPVVFLHGGLLVRRMWDGQFQFFAQRFQVVRYDMRSCGESETTPSGEPYTHHADLYRFLQALQIPHVSLVGLSNYAIALISRLPIQTS